MIILDAFYRFLPPEMDENDNGGMASLYNLIDEFAEQLKCCFILIHHASKGSQADKAVTDVGSGAGSQSRRPIRILFCVKHEEKDVIVLDAVVRSWPPIEPICLQWVFPVFVPVTASRSGQPVSGGEKRSTSSGPVEAKPIKIPWTVELFVNAFVKEEPQSADKDRIRSEFERRPNFAGRTPTADRGAGS